jgi:23S rRNA (uracil747-C5)-methyltransferase
METFCRYYNSNICRSCGWLERPYEEQVAAKEARLMAALKLGPDQLRPAVHSPPMSFRNKVKLSVTGTSENPVIGLLGVDDLDAGREILDCPVHHPTLNGLLPLIKDFIRRARLTPYSIAGRSGELKGLIAYVSGSGEIYLRFVLRSRESLDRLRKHLPELTKTAVLHSISANIQPVPHALLEGEEEIILSGPGSILQESGPVKQRLGPRAFVQTNETVARSLYATAAEWIRASGARRFCELFSGQGNFSFHASTVIAQGIGIELNPEAVAQANATAREHKLDHLHFIAADAATIGQELREFNPDLLLVNPPRRGLGEALPLLLAQEFPHIIYSSCSLESLAKDMASLGLSYQVVCAQVFDMFPHTEHFETLLLLRLRA